MDKFEEMMKTRAQMTEEQRMAMVEENKKMCICPSCPSYEGTGENGLIFCSMGKSEFIKEEKGCTCAGCPVTPKMGFTHIYFCTRGGEGQQRGMM